MDYYDNMIGSSEWQKKHNYDNIVKNDGYRIKGIPMPSWVLDVGANFGVFSARCRELFGASPLILAIEGDPDTYEYLKVNSINYGFESMLAPIGSRNGSLTHTHGKSEKKNPGSWRVKETNGECDIGCSRTLESIIQEYHIDLSKRGILKVDCEGCERFVLLNLDLMRCMWQISIEFHLHDTELKDIIQWFSQEILATHELIRGPKLVNKQCECVYRKRV